MILKLAQRMRRRIVAHVHTHRTRGEIKLWTIASNHDARRLSHRCRTR